MKLSALATTLALVFASAASAQQSPKDQAEQQHKSAMEKCNGIQDEAKDICKADTDSQKKVAEAQVKVTERDTPKNHLELEQAEAQAQYNVAKEKYDDQVGDAKKLAKMRQERRRSSPSPQAEKQAQAKPATSSSSTAGISAAEADTPKPAAQTSPPPSAATQPAPATSSASPAQPANPPATQPQ